MRLITALPLALILAACGGQTAFDSGDVAAGEVAFTVKLQNTTAPGSQTTSTNESFDVMFAPGILIFHDDSFKLYEPGAAITYAGFEALVEDGDNAPLIAELEALPSVFLVRSYAALDQDYNSTPMAPGDSAVLTDFAPPGARVTVATMYGESNDAFVATPPAGVPLWDADGKPVFGSITDQLSFWDAGTEVNEEPGAGANQPMRQPAGNSGADENGVVTAIDGTDSSGFTYPAATEALTATLEVPPE